VGGGVGEGHERGGDETKEGMSNSRCTVYIVAETKFKAQQEDIAAMWVHRARRCGRNFPCRSSEPLEITRRPSEIRRIQGIICLSSPFQK
jgi:hypothetical protein